MHQDGTQSTHNLELPDIKSESGDLDNSVANTNSSVSIPTGMSALTQITDTNTDSQSQSQHNSSISGQINQNSVAPGSTVGSISNSPMIADDVDLIEKEWVEKAKEIVNKTKDNPYLQNKAISEIKTDYIKKRYNKDLSKSE